MIESIFGKQSTSLQEPILTQKTGSLKGRKASVISPKKSSWSLSNIIKTCALLFLAASSPLAAAQSTLPSASTSPGSLAKCVDLIAGQHIYVGDVCHRIVGDELCTTYRTEGAWSLLEHHLWVGSDMDDMPQNKHGSPKYGHFPHKGTTYGAKETTICLTADDLGVTDICESPDLFVVSHAVVKKTNYSRGGTQTETAFGAGFPLGGSSWAMGHNLSFCTSSLFDPAALDEELEGYASEGLHDGVVGLQVTHNGGDPGKAYYTGQIDFDQDGVSELPELPFYCIDLARTISSGWYCALMVSTYNPEVGSLSAIIHEGNLDKANYILNTFAIGDSLDNGEPVISGGDIQRTLWALVFGLFTSPGAASSGASSTLNVNAMLAQAATSGSGFVPDCGGRVAVVLYPVDCDPEEIAAQAIIAQTLVTDFETACTETCGTC